MISKSHVKKKKYLNDFWGKVGNYCPENQTEEFAECHTQLEGWSYPKAGEHHIWGSICSVLLAQENKNIGVNTMAQYQILQI